MRCITSAVVGLALIAPLAACGGGEQAATPKALSKPAGPQKLSKAELIERTRPKLLKVFVDTQLGKATGTALVLDAERGLLLTNGHVVEGASEITVKPEAGKERIPARVVGTGMSPDLAVLKLQSVPEGLQAITFADSEDVSPGDTVLAMGFEANAHKASRAKARASFGFIDDTRIRNADLGPEIAPQRSLLLTSAAVNPGSSGGAIVDEYGEVVAVISFQGDGENQGYGIEADVVRESLPELRKGRAGTGLQTMPVRSLGLSTLAGVIYARYSEEGVSRYEAVGLARSLVRKGGLFVISATAGSPADRSGFEFGDVILTMNGLRVHDQTKHARVLGSSSAIKAEGYALMDDADPFTRRARVK